MASTVKTSTDRLAWLIENLQRIARMKDPIDMPSEQRVELSALADEVSRQLQDMAQARQVASASRRICRRWSRTRPAWNSSS